MNICKLEEIIHNAKWFSKLGFYEAKSDEIVLKSISDWEEVVHEWFPTNQEPLGIEDQDIKSKVKEIYKSTLQSFKHIKPKHEGLYYGPHDFTQAAKQSLLYVVRKAALESLMNSSEDLYRTRLLIFKDGHWPCGLTTDNKTIIL